jgi:tetratricopeptide (TPR) repeat protein
MFLRMTLSSLGGILGKWWSLCPKIAAGALYTLFFLVPLFFLPWTSDVIEANKQMLFIVLSVLGLLSWLGTMVFAKQLSFKSGWFHVVPAAFLVSILVSSILSIGGYQTWVGQVSQEYTSFLSLVLFVLFFYFVAHQTEDMRVQHRVLVTLLLSSAISGLITLCGMFDLLHLPFSFAASKGFNTIGTINAFIGFMSVVMFLGFAMWMVSRKGENRIIPDNGFGVFQRVLIVLVTIVTLIALVAVDFWVFWVMNIVGVALLAVFSFVETQAFPHPKRFILPLVVLLASVMFLFFNTPLKLGLPVVVTPTYTTSWQITMDSLSDGVHRLLFGTGPGTFLYDYLEYRPQEVNQSVFWSLRFDRAKSSALTMLATTGVVGAALWIALMVWVGLKALGRLLRQREHEEWKLTYVIFVGWFMMLLYHFLYTTNFSLQFLLWGLTGLLAARVMTKMWETDFSRSPRLGLTVSSVFVVLAVGLLASLFVCGMRYAAEVAFVKAVDLDNQDVPIEEVMAKLSTATTLNGFSDRYYRNLSTASLLQANEMISGVQGEMTDAQRTAIVASVEKSVQAAAKAVQLEPAYASNWSAQGSIYRDLMSFVQGAEDAAAVSYLKAIALDPVSPIHHVNLGRLYLTVADRARGLKEAENADLAKTAAEQEVLLLTQAEGEFNQAIALKGDYAPAHYYLAAVYERQGKLQDAASRLIALVKYQPTNIGLGFQLSILLMKLEEYDAARGLLEQIVALQPKYSNALWYLSSVYEIQGDTQKALEMVERVDELNPGNDLVAQRLRTLQGGYTSEEIPSPVEEGEEGATEGGGEEVAEE